ncbi:uncharacterized protein LOC6529995 isoform X2 [Drosophila yakuba]|uniref:MARVEL domain-containing protein n=1 Tax=Drosophila yakuba TaxID=7245 RepID=B4P4L4_DROYA|nr:uncharacterized protein LOC6529995 isoform X2 [Drosophila yakuba]EDW90653.1 uncharacterized protein Dyak_GE13387 [Drosophila yakuba]
MAIPTIKKCFCLELKWGALIAALFDLIFGGSCVGCTTRYRDSDGGLNFVWYAVALVHIVHIIFTILVIVSVFVANKKLIIPYLITGIIRIIMDFIFLIFVFIEDTDDVTSLVVIIINIVIADILWAVIFSWYKKLGGSVDV